MVHRGEVTKQKLEVIYGVIHRIIKNENCYYSDEQIKKLKENKNNRWWKNE